MARLVLLFAGIGILPGLVIFLVSVQFVSHSIDSWFDVKIESAIESGLNPFAESAMGAKGLMQVMAKVHHDKFEDVGGPQAALNPVANIRVGALILKDYVKRTGSVEGGLKTYVGAADLETDSGYGNKVLNEYKLLKRVSKGQNVSVRTPRAVPVPATIVAAKQTDVDTAKPEAKPMQETTTAAAHVPNVEPLAGL